MVCSMLIFVMKESCVITDVRAWNKKHGVMWMIYGVVMIISWTAGMLFGDSFCGMIVLLYGVLVPLVIIIWYYRKLTKKYKI